MNNPFFANFPEFILNQNYFKLQLQRILGKLSVFIYANLPNILIGIILIFSTISCSQDDKQFHEVQSVSAMRNVMWKGELGAKISFDSILPRKGLYGIGPLENLTGEITIINGVPFIAKINDNRNVEVTINKAVGAPFFVYSVVNNFENIQLPEKVTDLETLNSFLKKQYGSKESFFFKFRGEIEFSKIHIQNLESDTKVSSPKEAHAGQVNFELNTTQVELVGVYSNSAHGVYTHHDTNIHTHLISADKKYMGHCDVLKFDPKKVKFYIAKNQ